jgi:hypothetical protein
MRLEEDVEVLQIFGDLGSNGEDDFIEETAVVFEIPLSHTLAAGCWVLGKGGGKRGKVEPSNNNPAPSPTLFARRRPAR